MILTMNTQNLQQKNAVIDSESKGNYSHKNPIKFLTNSLESSLCILKHIF